MAEDVPEPVVGVVVGVGEELLELLAEVELLVFLLAVLGLGALAVVLVLAGGLAASSVVAAAHDARAEGDLAVHVAVQLREGRDREEGLDGARRVEVLGVGAVGVGLAGLAGRVEDPHEDLQADRLGAVEPG